MLQSDVLHSPRNSEPELFPVEQGTDEKQIDSNSSRGAIQIDNYRPVPREPINPPLCWKCSKQLGKWKCSPLWYSGIWVWVCRFCHERTPKMGIPGNDNRGF